MRRGWLLVASVLVLGAGLVKAGVLQLTWPPTFQAPANAESGEVAFITPAELKKRLDLGEEIVVADVRRRDSYDKLHLAGALSLPMDDHAKWGPTIAKETPLVMYCACESDESAQRAAHEIRRSYRHNRVMVLKGGLGGWVDAGYPVVEKKLPASLQKMKVK
ncbi:molybdopterin biosynthesis protein MoeB [compost metagenome]